MAGAHSELRSESADANRGGIFRHCGLPRKRQVRNPYPPTGSYRFRVPRLLGPGMTNARLSARVLRDRALDKQSRFQRGMVAAKAADDLNTERQAVAVVHA